MTHNNLLVCMFFLFNFLAHTFEVDNIDNMSQDLIVSQNNCTKLQGNRMYSINKVAECKISPENLYVVPATSTLPKNLSNRPLCKKMFCQGPHFLIQLCNVLSYVIRA